MEFIHTYKIKRIQSFNLTNSFRERHIINKDREGLRTCVYELLYDLLEKWSTCNLTKQLWKNLLPKDLEHIIFIHGYNDINDASIQILINKAGIS